ncbi:hypothetical protein BRD05_09930, partial [Halobacteriales archaeon QS_9_70_65]
MRDAGGRRAKSVAVPAGRREIRRLRASRHRRGGRRRRLASDAARGCCRSAGTARPTMPNWPPGRTVGSVRRPKSIKSVRNGDTPMGLRLLSYNVRYATLDDGPDAWSERRDGVADLVRSAAPDVVCFQEVWETQFEDLADRLPDYAWVRERTSSGEHTPVAYRTDRLSVVDREVFSLSETPSDRHAMDWETTVPRVTTAARLRGDDAAFVAASTHLDHGSERARRRGATLLAERFGDRPVPTVMAGDFNCTPADPPYRAMTEAGFRDARDDADASAGP